MSSTRVCLISINNPDIYNITHVIRHGCNYLFPISRDFWRFYSPDEIQYFLCICSKDCSMQIIRNTQDGDILTYFKYGVGWLDLNLTNK